MEPQRQQRSDSPAASRRRLRRYAVTAGLLAAILLLAGCGSAQDASSPATSAAPAAYTDISPEQLAGMLEQKDFVLINTHVPYEGEIEQTDLFLPYDQAAELVDQLPADKAAKVVV